MQNELRSRGWVDPRALVLLEGLSQLKKSSGIRNRTRDFPTCSILCQPTTLPRAPPGCIPWRIEITLDISTSKYDQCSQNKYGTLKQDCTLVRDLLHNGTFMQRDDGRHFICCGNLKLRNLRAFILSYRILTWTLLCTVWVWSTIEIHLTSDRLESWLTNGEGELIAILASF
jgi:hypothetical protein